MTTLHRCPHCDWYWRDGSVAEAIHAKRRCRPKRQPRGPSFRQRCRAALRERLAERLVLLPIVVRARLKIHPEQLRRVADGKSDFSPSTWRKLAPYLDVPSP